MTVEAFIVSFDIFAGKSACVMKSTDQDDFILVALTRGAMTIERRNRIAKLAQALAAECTGGIPMDLNDNAKVSS